MYLLIVNYTKPLEAVTPHFSTHAAWLTQYIDQDIFLFAGPNKSQSGGVILAKSIDKNKLMNVIAEDSFVKNNVAQYQVIEFDCKRTAQHLELLKTM